MLTRRIVLTAVLAPMVVLPLAGCGFERMLQGPDREEFTAQLQRAASSAPSFISGYVRYTNGLDTGLAIRGNITVRGTTQEAVRQSLLEVLRRIAVEIQDVEFPGRAFVLISASSDEIPTIATNSKGVLDQDHPEVSTDDLLEYFNLR